MHRKSYFPADLQPYPLHYAALRGYTGKVRELLTTAECNPYEPIQDGETALHVALAGNQPEVTDILIETFRKDFALVGGYLVKKFQCDPEDQFWLNRSVLVAASKEQCEQVKQLEDPVGNARDGILVLLRYPVGGEHAAVLQSNKNRCLELIELLKALFANGSLSCNNTGPAGSCDSLLTLAAFYGHVRQLENLIEYGADLSAQGQNKQTAFHAACDASQHDVIEILLSKYIDKFDPIAVDCDAFNGLYYVLLKKNKKSFEKTLEAMIKYEVNRSGVSESKAFNRIINVENVNWSHFSVWSQIDCVFWEQILGNVCEKYEYDLTYEWRECVPLLDMIQYKKMRKYHQEQIRRNPELLKVSMNGFTALHMLISSNELELVKYFYNSMHEQMKVMFECDAAFETLSTMMFSNNYDMMKLVLENHHNFLYKNLSKLHRTLENLSLNFNGTFQMLIEFIPEIKSLLKQKIDHLIIYSTTSQIEFDEAYNKLRDDFPSALAELHKSGKTLNDYSNFLRSFLRQAVIDDQVQLVENLLDANVDFDCLNMDERHPIHFVRSIEMLHLLVRKHPDGNDLVNRKDRNGFTLLLTLCASSLDCKEDLILELLKLGAKLDECAADQSTAVFYVHTESLFNFLTKGVEKHGYSGINVDHRDFEGSTALHRFLKFDSFFMSSIMLKNAKSFVNFNDKGESLLLYLVQVYKDVFNYYFKPILEERDDKTREMLEAEFEKSRYRASEIFAKACMNLNIFFIDKMLTMDLDFNVQINKRKTALLALLETFDGLPVNLVNQLLDKQVDVNIVDADGRSALLMFAFKFPILKRQGFDVTVAKKIISRGAKVDQVDNDGNTALHYACKMGDFDLMHVLIENGANYKIKNRQGLYCYQMAPCGVDEILSWLFSS